MLRFSSLFARAQSVELGAPATRAGPALSSSGDSAATRRARAWYWDAIIIFGVALGLRLVFSLLLANTYDRDEFVYLSFGRAVAHGAVPYRDFVFFHPPGIIVVLGVLNNLATLWWPLMRLLDAVIDCFTAVLVWRIGLQLYDRKIAFIAGLLYAVNPVVLLSAVRIDQEIILGALSAAGLTLLLTRTSHRTAAVAGACLAAACWVKYPAVVFLPIYLLAAPRRALATLAGFLIASGVLFIPYIGLAGSVFQDTVTWQVFDRYHTPIALRAEVTAISWLAPAVFALMGIVMRRNPAWLLVGFATGGIFVFTSSAYTHYFVPVALYSALLGAPVAAGLARGSRPILIAACLALTGVWAALVLSPASNGIVPTWSFSAARPVVKLVERAVPPRTPVLGDSFEYAYLADRPPLANYFWNYHHIVTAAALEARLPRNGVVVLYPQPGESPFPYGFSDYLPRRYVRVRVAGAEVWLSPAAARRIGNR